jgi:cell division septation protein DedD
MASGGKRGAGERVLESKHVIGLFLLMLLFSGMFFTLGYVMGRNQYDGQVRAATSGINKSETAALPRSEPQPKKFAEPAATPEETDPATNFATPSEWNFPAVGKPASEPHLEKLHKANPTAAPPSRAVSAKPAVQPAPTPIPVKSTSKIPSPSLIPSGAYVIQVAALLRQDDALAIASSLQEKHYTAYVQAPAKDKYYRVQVGPFKDQKSADAAKKGLEGEGFKAFYVKH